MDGKHIYHIYVYWSMRSSKLSRFRLWEHIHDMPAEIGQVAEVTYQVLLKWVSKEEASSEGDAAMEDSER